MDQSRIISVCNLVSFCFILLSIILMMFFEPGTGHVSLYIMRLCILAAVLLQLPIIILDHYFFHSFPRYFLIPLYFFIAFLFLAVAQYINGFYVFSDKLVLGTLNRYLTMDHLVQLVFYVFSYFLFIKFFSRSPYLERFISVFTLSVFTVAIFACIKKVGAGGYPFWKGTPTNSFGPFINENHFGGLITLTLPFMLGFLYYRYRKFLDSFQDTDLAENFSLKVKAMFNHGIIFYGLMVCFTIAATFIASSRFSSTVLLIVLIAVGFLFLKKHFSISKCVIFILLLAGIIATILIVNDQGFFYSYFNWDKISAAFTARINIYLDSLKLFGVFPVFGTGLGTFRCISAKYLTGSQILNWYHHAENDYIELLTDVGLIGFFLLLFSIVLVVNRGYVIVSRNPSQFNKTMVFQAVAAVILIGVMELSDFHLRIPLIALLFVLQLAVITRLSIKFVTPAELKGKQQEVTVSNISKWVIVGVLFLLISLLASYSWREYKSQQLMLADYYNENNLLKASKLSPQNDRIYFKVAQNYFDRSKTLGYFETIILLNKAKTSIGSAIDFNPMYAEYYYHGGLIHYYLNDDEKAAIYIQKAIDRAPTIIEYQNGLDVLKKNNPSLGNVK